MNLNLCSRTICLWYQTRYELLILTRIQASLWKPSFNAGLFSETDFVKESLEIYRFRMQCETWIYIQWVPALNLNTEQLAINIVKNIKHNQKPRRPWVPFRRILYSSLIYVVLIISTSKPFFMSVTGKEFWFENLSMVWCLIDIKYCTQYCS